MSGRLVVSFHGVEGDLDQVQDLCVEGPPVGDCLGGEPGVEFFGDAEREFEHAVIVPLP